MMVRKLHLKSQLVMRVMTDAECLKTFESKLVPELNRLLERKIDTSVSQTDLRNSMSYSVLAGGKRLRPLLTLAVLSVHGVNIDADSLQIAGALELLHTYSLIHDDLPAMDNDDLRRGKPTNHVKFGAGMATLAGDGLLTLAFDWLSSAPISAEKRIELVSALSIAAGPRGMVSGQATDIVGVNKDYNFEELRNLHLRKTGALIHYAVEAGCILSDLRAAEKESLLIFADSFGLAFQIYDDINDVVGSEEKLGKRVHVDASQHKNTYPSLLGMEGSYKALSTAIDNGKQALVNLGQQTGVDYQLLTSFFSYFDVSGE